jgi:hypothetical protein
MGHPEDEPSHGPAVDAWIETAIAADASPTDVVDLFRSALEAIWSRGVITLGSVTLTAIAERVLNNVTTRYSFLAAINPRPNGDARWKQQLRERLVGVPRLDLIEGLRFGLVELLTVIGRLTAEILSSELHAALRAAPASVEMLAPAALHAVPTATAGKAQS